MHVRPLPGLLSAQTLEHFAHSGHCDADSLWLTIDSTTLLYHRKQHTFTCTHSTETGKYTGTLTDKESGHNSSNNDNHATY